MPGSAYRSLQELAAEQFGYFTTSQAREWGVSPMALVMMSKRSTAERVSHSVYRIAGYPVSPLASFMEASLWPGRMRGVISHESVLALHEVSDVSPAAVHVTVPRLFRTHRTLPKRLVVHRADLVEDELDTFEGIPITTLERAIRDCSAAHLGPALVRQAIEDGFHKGLLTKSAAGRLRDELLPARNP